MIRVYQRKKLFVTSYAHETLRVLAADRGNVVPVGWDCEGEAMIFRKHYTLDTLFGLGWLN